MATENSEASCDADPNFAVICGFLERFGPMCGLNNIDFLDLQEMLENTQEVPQALIDLHIKLLRKARKSVSSERWERALIKLCHTSYSSKDGWELERFGYKKARIGSKLRILKQLLEMQFDYNQRFKNDINKMSAAELRSQPIGRDSSGGIYWYQCDESCRIKVYKDDPDDESWSLIAKDRDGLVNLISKLNNGDSTKSSSEPVSNEDSNSLEVVEKPMLDTGQKSKNPKSTENLKIDESDNAQNQTLKTEDVVKKGENNNLNEDQNDGDLTDVDEIDEEDDENVDDENVDDENNDEENVDNENIDEENIDNENIDEENAVNENIDDENFENNEGLDLSIKSKPSLLDQPKKEFMGIKGKYIREESASISVGKAVRSASKDALSYKRPLEDYEIEEPKCVKQRRMNRPTLLIKKTQQQPQIHDESDVDGDLEEEEDDENIDDEDVDDENIDDEEVEDEEEEEVEEEEDENDEVGEEIEEPVMLIRGQGNGHLNKSCPVIVSEEIEDTFYFYGVGNGYDCQTGNESPGKDDDKTKTDVKNENTNDNLQEASKPTPEQSSSSFFFGSKAFTIGASLSFGASLNVSSQNDQSLNDNEQPLNVDVNESVKVNDLNSNHVPEIVDKLIDNKDVNKPEHSSDIIKESQNDERVQENEVNTTENFDIKNKLIDELNKTESDNEKDAIIKSNNEDESQKNNSPSEIEQEQKEGGEEDEIESLEQETKMISLQDDSTDGKIEQLERDARNISLDDSSLCEGKSNLEEHMEGNEKIEILEENDSKSNHSIKEKNEVIKEKEAEKINIEDDVLNLENLSEKKCEEVAEKESEVEEESEERKCNLENKSKIEESKELIESISKDNDENLKEINVVDNSSVGNNPKVTLIKESETEKSDKPEITEPILIDLSIKTPITNPENDKNEDSIKSSSEKQNIPLNITNVDNNNKIGELKLSEVPLNQTEKNDFFEIPKNDHKKDEKVEKNILKVDENELLKSESEKKSDNNMGKSSIIEEIQINELKETELTEKLINVKCNDIVAAVTTNKIENLNDNSQHNQKIDNLKENEINLIENETELDKENKIIEITDDLEINTQIEEKQSISNEKTTDIKKRAKINKDTPIAVINLDDQDDLDDSDEPELISNSPCQNSSPDREENDAVVTKEIVIDDDEKELKGNKNKLDVDEDELIIDEKKSKNVDGKQKKIVKNVGGNNDDVIKNVKSSGEDEIGDKDGNGVKAKDIKPIDIIDGIENGESSTQEPVQVRRSTRRKPGDPVVLPKLPTMKRRGKSHPNYNVKNPPANSNQKSAEEDTAGEVQSKRSKLTKNSSSTLPKIENEKKERRKNDRKKEKVDLKKDKVETIEDEDENKTEKVETKKDKGQRKKDEDKGKKAEDEAKKDEDEAKEAEDESKKDVDETKKVVDETKKDVDDTKKVVDKVNQDEEEAKKDVDESKNKKNKTTEEKDELMKEKNKTKIDKDEMTKEKDEIIQEKDETRKEKVDKKKNNVVRKKVKDTKTAIDDEKIEKVSGDTEKDETNSEKHDADDEENDMDDEKPKTNGPFLSCVNIQKLQEPKQKTPSPLSIKSASSDGDNDVDELPDTVAETVLNSEGEEVDDDLNDVDNHSSNEVILIDDDGQNDSDDCVEVTPTVKTMTLSTFQLDVTDSPPRSPSPKEVVRKKRTRQDVEKGAGDNDDDDDEEEVMSSKKRKLRGKRQVDKDLRRSVEEQKKMETISSEEEEQEENAKEKQKDETKKKPPANKSGYKRRKTLLGLDIPEALDFIDTAPGNVRQSRRIAQLKIREEAERRKIEEMTMVEVEKKRKSSKKDEDKDYKVEKVKYKKSKTSTQEDEPILLSDDEAEMRNKKKKKKRRKNVDPRKIFDESNPWRSSSDSSSNEEIAEEEEEEISDPGSPLFKSDHEFSPESDIEGGEEVQPLKRARTARKEDDCEEIDDCACQKCGKKDHPEWILLCDGCENGWHCSCIRPALLVIPEGDWFCPPCQHVMLVKNLERKLIDFDKKLAKRQIVVRRRERLAYVGISLANVLPVKKSIPNKDLPPAVKQRAKKVDDEVSESSESESSNNEDESGSESESDSDEEPIYQLRQRRQAHSYRFNDYDELINSAIRDEMDAVKGAGNQGKGKDISTIVNAQEEKTDVTKPPEEVSEENAVQKEPVDLQSEKPENIPKPIENEQKQSEQESEEEEEEPIKPAKKLIGRKKARKLNSLDVSSEDDADSDEDFKGSSSDDDEDDYEEDLGSDSSDYGGRGRKKGPVRRSTRARRSRYDRDFINDDSDDDEEEEEEKKRKKGGHRPWTETESEESDQSWGRRKRSKKNNVSSSSPKKRKPKKSKKRFDDSEEDDRNVNKKKRKIKYGGLNDDDDDEMEDIGRRTRGKKINYAAVLASDSDDDEPKKTSEKLESDDDFVAEDAEQDEEDDEAIDEQELKKLQVIKNNASNTESNIIIQSNVIVPQQNLLENFKESVGNQDEEEDDINPIEAMNRNLEEMDEEEMEKLMEEEEYANKQLQLMAMQLEKEKKRKEREALKKVHEGDDDEEKPPVKIPQKRGRKPKNYNPNGDGVPKNPNDPLLSLNQPSTDINQLNIPQPLNSLSETDSPKKRRGRGKGKKTLEKEAAAAVAAAGTVPTTSRPPPPVAVATTNVAASNENATPELQTAKLTVATPPQPFAQTQPVPSVITRMLQGGRPPGNYRQIDGFYGEQPVAGEAGPPPGNAAMPPGALQPPIGQPYIQGAPGNAPSPQYRPPPAPLLNPFQRSSPVPNQPQLRLRHPAPPPPPPGGIYQHHSMEPSPSVGGSVSIPPTGSTPEEGESPVTVLADSETPHGSSKTVEQSQHPRQPPQPTPPPPQMAPRFGTPPVVPPTPHIRMPYQPSVPHPTSFFYMPQNIGGEENMNYPYGEQFSETNSPQEAAKGYEEENSGEFGGLVSYFSSQREDDLDT